MPRDYSPRIVTANDLLEGDVVYLTADDRWSRRLEEAEVITDEAHGVLRLLDAERQQDIVVGVYLAEVKDLNNVPQPVHFREKFRSRGPSNYVHGKQVEL